MKLELGKTYRTQMRSLVKIVKKSKDTYFGNNGFSYDENGNILNKKFAWKFQEKLVKEVS